MLSVTIDDQAAVKPLSASASVDIYVAPIVLAGARTSGTAGVTLFAPAQAPVYELQGTITGSSGSGLLINSSDANLADTLTVMTDVGSSIAITTSASNGGDFDELVAKTAGANVVVSNAGLRMRPAPILTGCTRRPATAVLRRTVP